MRNSNLLFALLGLACILFVGISCKSLMGGNTGDSAANTAPANTSTANKPTNSTTSTANIEPADFTMTAEEFDKEFTREGVTDKDLEKYESKNIAVSGRVSMLVNEKKGTVQPWVTLNAPGIGHGVSCYFDDDNLADMQKLKMDKLAKVQGFQDDFIVPKVSPRLKHCVVLEGAN